MVDLEACQLKVLAKKQTARHSVWPRLRDALSAYMELRDKVVTRLEPALFVSAKGRRLTYPQVRACVSDNLARVSSLKKRSPHVLRHTFATAMLNHAPDLRALRSCWGIQELTTTEIYTHTTFEQLKKVYKSAHPRLNP